MPRTGRPRDPAARVTVECTGCGAPVERWAKQVRESRTGKFFCSDACKVESGSGGKPKTGQMRPCVTCGADFYVRAHRKDISRYCSRECQAAAREVANKIKRTCEVCEAEFEIRESLLKWNAGKYCSRECTHEGRRSRGERKPRVNRDGYVDIWVNGKYVRQHRIVMSEFLGRPLADHENVHHKNGDRADNAIGNLELWSTSQPCGQRALDKLAWAREIVAAYGPIEHLLQDH